MHLNVNVNVNNCNSKYHKKIKRKPSDFKTNTYIDFDVENNDKDSKLKVGDPVRISHYKSIVGKGYTPNWPKEVFIIKEVENILRWT